MIISSSAPIHTFHRINPACTTFRDRISRWINYGLPHQRYHIWYLPYWLDDLLHRLMELMKLAATLALTASWGLRSVFRPSYSVWKRDLTKMAARWIRLIIAMSTASAAGTLSFPEEEKRLALLMNSFQNRLVASLCWTEHVQRERGRGKLISTFSCPRLLQFRTKMVPWCIKRIFPFYCMAKSQVTLTGPPYLTTRCDADPPVYIHAVSKPIL